MDRKIVEYTVVMHETGYRDSIRETVDWYIRRGWQPFIWTTSSFLLH